MITHEIIVEEPPAYKPYTYPTHTNLTPYQHSGPPYHTLNYKTKLGYAEYLNRLIFKKGNYVCKTTARYPYTPDMYWRIKDIQEVVHLVSFHPYTGLPFCINIINMNGDDIWVTSSEIFTIHNAPNGVDIPL
jgi:hypothetical protein